MRQIALENPGFLDTRPKFPDFSGKKKEKKRLFFSIPCFPSWPV